MKTRLMYEQCYVKDLRKQAFDQSVQSLSQYLDQQSATEPPSPEETIALPQQKQQEEESQKKSEERINKENIQLNGLDSEIAINELDLQSFRRTRKVSILNTAKDKRTVSQQEAINIKILSQIPPPPVTQPKSLNSIYNQLECFDILLFRNETFLSKMQRLFTRSECDHVGIVVSYNYQKYILESGSSGVTLSSLRAFLKKMEAKYKINEIGKCSKSKGQVQTCLSFRKLRNRQVGEESYNLLTEFLNKTIGKDYKFSPIYLFSETYQKDGDGYFCSELVAQCLKYCRIVPPSTLTRPSYSYLPKHFWGRQASEYEDFDGEVFSFKEADLLEKYYEYTKKVFL